MVKFVTDTTISKVKQALRWFIENDDTNDEPGNKFWLAGLKRGKLALQDLEEEVGDE